MGIKRDKYGRRVFLEEDCPIEELSIESQREREPLMHYHPYIFYISGGQEDL
jgi:hypothetical protein